MVKNYEEKRRGRSGGESREKRAGGRAKRDDARENDCYRFKEVEQSTLVATLPTPTHFSIDNTMVSSDQAETYLLACTSIVRDLIAAFQSSKEISLNELRNRYAKKLKLKGVPRLVDILSAVPVEWQDRLRGALRAKPVRTASGVSSEEETLDERIADGLSRSIKQIAVVAVMCKPHRCPHVAMTGNICV